MALEPIDPPIPPTRMLVIVRINAKERVIPAAKAIQDTLKRISNGEMQLAFSSAGYETFGIFIKVTRHQRAVLAQIEHTCETRPEDNILVLEIGERWTGAGNSRGWQWLQHH